MKATTAKVNGTRPNKCILSARWCVSRPRRVKLNIIFPTNLRVRDVFLETEIDGLVAVFLEKTNTKKANKDRPLTKRNRHQFKRSQSLTQL